MNNFYVFTRNLSLLFFCCSCHAQILSGVLNVQPSGGGATFSLAHSAVGESSPLTVTATTAGNANVFCMGYVGATGQTITITDNASGGSNTYVARATANGVHTANTFVTRCWDSLGTTNGGATAITVTGLTSSYRVFQFWEAHRTSGSWVFDLGAALNNGTGTGTNVPGPALAMTGSPGFGVAMYIVNSGISTNPAAGNVFNIGNLISSGGNGGNATIQTSSGTYTSAVTDANSGDTYCASGVAYK